MKQSPKNRVMTPEVKIGTNSLITYVREGGRERSDVANEDEQEKLSAKRSKVQNKTLFVQRWTTHHAGRVVQTYGQVSLMSVNWGTVSCSIHRCFSLPFLLSFCDMILVGALSPSLVAFNKSNRKTRSNKNGL